MDYQGIEQEWYDGKYSAEAYARVVDERHKGLRLSRVVTGGSLCPGNSNISGGRVPMINNQTAQHLPLNKPEPPQLMAGVEACWAKTVVDARIDAASEVVVLKRIPKYRIVPGVVRESNTEYIVWRETESDKIGITEVPMMISEHAFATSMLTKTAALENMNYGDILRRDEILAYGRSRTAEGNYAYGRDMNWAWGGKYTTNEDAIEVSDRFCDEMKSTKTDSVSFWLHGDDVLMNVHGSVNDVRPLPAVGDVIGANGIVAAIRKNIRAFSLANLRRESLTKPNRPFDKAFTSIAGSRVVEVKVMRHGRGDFKYMSSPTVRYLDTLADSSLNASREILAIDSAERRSRGARYPRHLSWHTMVVQAEKDLLASGVKTDTVSRKVPSTLRSGENVPASKPTMGDKPYTYLVTITLVKEHTPALGDKFTNRHGAKAVIGKITKLTEMYKDRWGRYVDVVANPIGVSNRNNPSQLFEHYGNDAAFHAYNHLCELKGFEAQWNYLFGFYEVASIESAHTVAVKCPTDQDKQAHLNSVLAAGKIGIINENGDPTTAIHGIGLLEDSSYCPPYDKVEFVNEITGEKHLTLPAIRIAPVYTFALDKIGKYANATNIAPRQSLGFVAKATSRDKDLTHISQTSNRHSGYTEVRATAANSDPDDAAYTLATNNSQMAMETRVENMLDGGLLGAPIDVGELSNGRGLELFNHELNAFGHQLTRGEDDE